MWEISVIGQTAAFFYSAALGVILGFFYDIIRATRRAGANSFVAVFIGDIIFWVLSAVLVFLLLMAVTNGEIRGYILISCLSGFLIYHLTLGRIVSAVFAKVFIFFKKLIAKASRKTAQIAAFTEKQAKAVPVRFTAAAKRILKGWLLSVKKLLKK